MSGSLPPPTFRTHLLQPTLPQFGGAHRGPDLRRAASCAATIWLNLAHDATDATPDVTHGVRVGEADALLPLLGW